MRYFKKYYNPLEFNKMHYYVTEMDISPTIYLPYSPQIAEYYKFEANPIYKLEYMAPSSKKIEHLLQLRQEIIARNPALWQPIPNNNNN